MDEGEVEVLQQLTQRVCENLTAYVGAQLDGSEESMAIMQSVVLQLNDKYSRMQKEVEEVGKLSSVMKKRASLMQSKMRSIDAVDEELTELEDMVDQLDAYTGSLQTKLEEVVVKRE